MQSGLIPNGHINENYYTNASTSLVKIIVCRRFCWSDRLIQIKIHIWASQATKSHRWLNFAAHLGRPAFYRSIKSGNNFPDQREFLNNPSRLIHRTLPPTRTVGPIPDSGPFLRSWLLHQDWEFLGWSLPSLRDLSIRLWRTLNPTSENSELVQLWGMVVR